MAIEKTPSSMQQQGLQGQIGLQAPPPAQVPAQVVNVVAQPTAPQLVDATPRSLVAANTVRLKHDTGNVETNKAIEVQISRLASESAAAHHTVDALLKSVFKLAENIEGEKAARLNLLSAYTGTEANPSLTAIGQNDAGAFVKLVNDVLHDRATPAHHHGDDGAQAANKDFTPQSSHSSDQAWTLREKGTAFYNLTNSTYFNGLVQKVQSTAEQAAKDQEKGLTNSPAQQKLGELRQLVDVERIVKLKPTEPDKNSTHTTRSGLEIYTGFNESGQLQTEHPELYEVKDREGNVKNPASLDGAKGGSLSANQAAYRAVPVVKEAVPGDTPKTEVTDKNRVFTTAQHLLDEGRLTERELRLAQSSPRNHIGRTDYQFGTQQGISYYHALKTDRTLRRDDAKTLVKENAFKADSKLSLDQVIVQRGNGFAVWNVKKNTGFAKDAEAHAKPTVAGPSGTTDRFMTAARLLAPATIKDLGLQGAQADTQLKELTRWLATGYLVDDNHHSMLEVSLGAANHGLDAQWGSNLYVSPFSEEIQSSKFTISSDQVMTELDQMSEVKVDRNYRRDLKAGLEWKEGDKRITQRTEFNGRGDIHLTTDKPASDVGKNDKRKYDPVARLAQKVKAQMEQPVEPPASDKIPAAPPFVKVEKNYREEQLAKQNAANQAPAVEPPDSANTPPASP
jgi:hypothetical protein